MSISPKQLEANRRNAQKSTGPRTTEGKERSRANATTHGLTAATTIYRPIRHEDPADYDELRGKLVSDWNPVGTPELLAVEMIAAAFKRAQRAEAMEAAYFDGAMQTIQLRHGKPTTPSDNDDLGCGIVMGSKENKLTWETLDRYRRNAWLDYNRAVEQMRRLQKDRLDRETKETRAHNTRMAYLRNTHMPTRRAVPADSQMASFGPLVQRRAELRLASRPGLGSTPAPTGNSPCNPSKPS